MKYLKLSWEKITNNGVDEAALGREAVKIRLLNQLIFITFITSILAMITQISTQGSKTIILITLGNLIIEATAIYCAYRKKHHIARFLACWLFPSVIAIDVLILGGNFGEANIFTGLAFASFIIFDDKKHIQIPLVIYTCTLFILSKLYIVNYSIESVIAKNPYDEIVTFPMVILILGLIVLLYQKSLKRYEEQQAILIIDLEQKNKELININEELEQFTYIASHDLKTPLRTLNSHVSLAKRHLNRRDYEAIETDLDFISQGAKQMYALVSDILEYKSIGNEEEVYEILDLNQIITNTLQNLEILIKEYNVEITNHSFPKIYGRERDFIILFQNFIENGIKYNESNTPQIELSTEYSTNEFIILIQDNGIGIAPEYHKKIFQFFKRLHTQERYQGTGIGLGLCKKIVQNYNGNITINSEEGNGATFKISLPINILKR